MAIVRDLFPGGNTSEGFFSYYDYIIEKDANRIFILKGGPGVGKSSLMKNIGKEFIDKGYDLEYHHCSSDCNSLDAIVMPKLKVAFIDGTSPHIVDPKNPGAVDEIINLGEFWDKDKMEENKNEILSVNSDVGKYFKRAYRFLRATRPIMENIISMNMETMNFGEVNLITNELITEIVKENPYSSRSGKVRHLFGSAYTPTGHIDFNDSILSIAKKIYKIKGDHGTGKTTILRKIYSDVIERGLDVEVFHSPLIPQKIESIYIKDIQVGVTISDELADNKDTLDLNKHMNKDVLYKYKEKVDEDKKIINNLVSKAINNLKEAKSAHDELEKLYVPNIDFDKVDVLRKDITDRILKYDK